MAVAFEFSIPVYDSGTGKWTSRGYVYNVQTNEGAPPTFAAVDGFNPADITVTSPNFDTVRQTWANLASQVESRNTAKWAAHAAHDPPQKFGPDGAPI